MDYIDLLKKIGIKDYLAIGKSLNDNLEKFGITNQENAFFFIANCANESGGFTKYKESLYYTTAERLKVVFPRAFDPVKFPETAKYNPNDYLKNSVKLANLVYNDNIFPKGLGNTVTPQDGSLFLGRGAIQITGRNNYKIASELSGIDFIKNPELLEKPDYALIASMAYWKHNKINTKTTLLATRQVVAGNYSNNPFGLAEVQAWYNKIKKAL